MGCPKYCRVHGKTSIRSSRQGSSQVGPVGMLQLFLVLTLYKQPGLAGWPPGRHLRVVTLFPASSMTSTGSARRACAVFKICFQQDSLCLLVFSCFQRVQQASILLCLELTGEFGGIWPSAARSARISSPGFVTTWRCANSSPREIGHAAVC